MRGTRCFLMRSSINSFKCSDPAEKKAMMFALLSCFLFIGFLTAVNRRAPRDNIAKGYAYAPSIPAKPVPPPRITDRPLDMNSKFRVAPSNFSEINFLTRSYGNYQLSNGTNRDLVLIDGRFREIGATQHTFELDDVLYADLTGDGLPEAIALLTHTECGRECDGGKSLVYVYSKTEGLNEILKWESGSGMESCSLKTIEVKNRRLTLELFGKCPRTPGSAREFVIADTYDLTRLEFFFNGRKLVPKLPTYLTVPNRYEVTYGVNVRISEDRNSGVKL